MSCVQEVDAYWLQRRIAQAYGNLDAAAAQALAEEVLQRLQARATQHHLSTVVVRCLQHDIALHPYLRAACRKP